MSTRTNTSRPHQHSRVPLSPATDSLTRPDQCRSSEAYYLYLSLYCRLNRRTSLPVLGRARCCSSEDCPPTYLSDKIDSTLTLLPRHSAAALERPRDCRQVLPVADSASDRIQKTVRHRHQPKRRNNPKIFKCGPCDVICPSSNHVASHEQTRANKRKISFKTLRCEHCDLTFFSIEDHQRHINVSKHKVVVFRANKDNKTSLLLMATPTPTLEPPAEVYNQLQAQLTNAQQQIYSLQNDIKQTKTNLEITQTALENAQNHLASRSRALKQKDSGKKESVKRSTNHMKDYLPNALKQKKPSIAIHYLDGHAHECWIV